MYVLPENSSHALVEFGLHSLWSRFVLNVRTISQALKKCYIILFDPLTLRKIILLNLNINQCNRF